jgi:hypothetical protein
MEKADWFCGASIPARVAVMNILKWLDFRDPTPKQKAKRRPKLRDDSYPPQPAQDVDEFRQFVDLIGAENVGRYLEIGARHGGSFNAIMQSLPAGSMGVAVDLPGVAWGRDDSEAVLRQVVSDLCRDGYRAELVIGRSQDPTIIAAVATPHSMRFSSMATTPIKVPTQIGSTLEAWLASLRSMTSRGTT